MTPVESDHCSTRCFRSCRPHRHRTQPWPGSTPCSRPPGRLSRCLNCDRDRPAAGECPVPCYGIGSLRRARTTARRGRRDQLQFLREQGCADLAGLRQGYTDHCTESGLFRASASWLSNNVRTMLKERNLMVNRQHLCGCVLILAFGAAPGAVGETGPIADRTAVADGLKLRYLTAGHGPAIVLLHGYAETSRMWRPLIPR